MVLILLLPLLASGLLQPSSSLSCMVWLCLERCNETGADIARSLQQLGQLPLSAAAFERYNLGVNGTVVVNNLTNVGPTVKALGMQAYPMLSSWPYPPEFLTWMRQLWLVPAVGDAFIRRLHVEAARNGWDGYQVDFEPTAKATPEDARQYALFLSKMARDLAPLRVLPTVATWNSIWNLELLGKTAVHRVITMSTYATKWATFDRMLNLTLQSIRPGLLGVGVENWPDLDERFEDRIRATIARGVDFFAVWKMPLSDEWMTGLKRHCAVTQAVH